MKIIFEEYKLQKQYEKLKKNLIDKYGEGCSSVYFSPTLVTNLDDNSRYIYTVAVFEKSGISLSEELIEDGDNLIKYSHSLKEYFEEYEVEPDEYSEVIQL